jgi:nucleotide-binding universal stress UspA family protein
MPGTVRAPYTPSMLAIAQSTTEFLLILLAAWLATGLTLAVVMGRRGHGAFQWFLLGAVLGPLALPLAWTAIRDEHRPSPRSLGEAMSSGGSVDVLVGVDGSLEAENALKMTIALVGANIGRLMLAHVTTFGESEQGRRDEELAVELLDAAASSVPEFAPGRVLLTGRPADALIKHATEEGFDLLAIGRRGSGASKALLGSTATRTTNGPIPVLVI